MVVDGFRIYQRHTDAGMEKMDIKHIVHIMDDQYLVLPKWQKIAWKMTFNGMKR